MRNQLGGLALVLAIVALTVSAILLAVGHQAQALATAVMFTGLAVLA